MPVAVGTLAIVQWVLAVMFSLVASSDYAIPVSIAVAAAIVHFQCVYRLVRFGRGRLRFVWLGLSIPLAVVTLDNLGRLSYALGGPLFRILI
ncbi:MAG: hypothetical protein GY944_30950 [bacterium]|nr:hypothetical protein [bacterium]